MMVAASGKQKGGDEQKKGTVHGVTVDDESIIRWSRRVAQSPKTIKKRWTPAGAQGEDFALRSKRGGQPLTETFSHLAAISATPEETKSVYPANRLVPVYGSNRTPRDQQGDPRRETSVAAHRVIVRFTATCGALFVIYLLFAQDCSPPELVAGTVAAVAVAVLLEKVRLENAKRCRVRARWLASLLRRVLPQVLRDSFRLIRFLAHGVRNPRERGSATGEIREVPFDPHYEERPGEARARRSLVVLGICLPPNRFVVAAERSPYRLLVHELVPSDQPPGRRDPQWPL